MTDNADLWDVRELPGGLALEQRAGAAVALQNSVAEAGKGSQGATSVSPDASEI